MRICCILLLAAFVLPLTAQADVIYEPFDSFYEQNRMDCTYVGRSYTAKGPNGEVTLYTSPEDSGIEKTYRNGAVLYVSYSYPGTDGVLWGCCDSWDDGVTGWAPMAYLELIYDGKSFAEEHADQFTEVQMALDTADLDGKEIYFWQYPGSKDCVQVLARKDYSPELFNTYTDEKGYQWGQCGYYMGIKGHWINLDDPAADYETLFPDMPEATIPAETEITATGQVEEIKPAANDEKMVVILAVAAVVAVTFAMLVLLKKKQK